MAAPFHLRVFLASPGDVSNERAHALEVLDQLQYAPGLRGRITVESVAWDKPGAGTPMLATMTPQEAIAQGLPKPAQCDIVVVVLWSRMGTPLPPEYTKADDSRYLSGTEWEYWNAVEERGRTKTRPEILIYRRTGEPRFSPSEMEGEDNPLKQWKNVQGFFETFRNADGSIRGGVNPYDTPDSFRKALDEHLKRIAFRLVEAGAPEVAEPAKAASAPNPPPLWQGSPFPGLRTFTPDDAPIFFGRGRETDELVAKLAAPSTRVVVVVGASGSGKSSLVAAGLLPGLMSDAISGSKDWLLPRVLPAAPGERKQWAGLRFTPREFDNPFDALAAKFAPLLPDESITARGVAEGLETDPSTIGPLVESALSKRPAWAELLMFVDQFEELFADAVAETQRAAFIALLVKAAQTPRLRIVATIRADFYDRCLKWPGLAELLRTATFPLAAPSVAALYEMITEPAARAGLEFEKSPSGEKSLPTVILEATATQPGGLALLAFALHELYEAREPDGKLTRRAYDAFGGVEKAIGQRAEATLKSLPKRAQTQIHDVFLKLIDVDERAVATRRRVRRRELVRAAEEAAVLVDAFVAARLLVADRDATGEAVIEVAHEALFREWPRLADWIVERADGIRLWRQAQAAAVEWEKSGHQATYLWPHERLVFVDQAFEQLGIDRARLDEPVKSFVRPEAERLLEELERPETSHYRRAEIGDRLDHIGDPRPGVGLRPDGVPDIVWCEVQAGTVTLLEKNASTFHVERFFIGKYPITYRQYKAFLDDPAGYGDARWWQGLEHHFLAEQYRPVGNCPAEEVSWYDAMAYCRWLSSRLSYEVSLPTEWQWQQAATGGHNEYEYPLGSDWIEGCANTGESRLSRSTAVGMYPHGAAVQESGDKVLDLAGNISEWCLNRYYVPSDVSVEPNDDRTLRGGSWRDSRVYAGCAYRDRWHPGHRGSYLGLRVVCVSPIR